MTVARGPFNGIVSVGMSPLSEPSVACPSLGAVKASHIVAHPGSSGQGNRIVCESPLKTGTLQGSQTGHKRHYRTLWVGGLFGLSCILCLMNPPSTTPGLASDSSTFASLVEAVRQFRDDRDWAQFHTPKNLAAAVAIEAAELQEQFLWKTDAEVDADAAVPAKLAAISDEIADVVMFAILLADRLDINLADAIKAKLAANALKYPVNLARGSARKYTELRDA